MARRATKGMKIERVGADFRRLFACSSTELLFGIQRKSALLRHSSRRLSDSGPRAPVRACS
jgi:hypothetical protein